MAACYHWLRFDTHHRMKHVLLGAVFSAMAVMTKGVFTLITIGSGLVCMWAYQGRWRELLRLKWWLAGLLTAVCVTPELLALYRQFDAHPEKPCSTKPVCPASVFLVGQPVWPLL